MIKEIEDSIRSYHKYLDEWVLKNRSYIRIITDKPILFPKYYEILNNHKFLEVDHLSWDKRPGWGKPDKIIGGLEIYYLWKNMKYDCME